MREESKVCRRASRQRRERELTAERIQKYICTLYRETNKAGEPAPAKARLKPPRRPRSQPGARPENEGLISRADLSLRISLLSLRCSESSPTRVPLLYLPWNGFTPPRSYALVSPRGPLMLHGRARSPSHRRLQDYKSSARAMSGRDVTPLRAMCVRALCYVLCAVCAVCAVCAPRGPRSRRLSRSATSVSQCVSAARSAAQRIGGVGGSRKPLRERRLSCSRMRPERRDGVLQRQQAGERG